jgi:hypothetical protein
MPGPSQPKPREWETDLVRPIVENGEMVAVDLDREASHQLFADVESILFRMGGAVLIGAKREQDEDGTWVTTGYKVSVESFMPAVAKQPQVNMGNGPEPVAPPPEAVEPTVEPVEATVYCGKTEGCELPEGHDGECVTAPPPVSATAGTEAELEPATIE